MSESNGYNGVRGADGTHYSGLVSDELMEAWIASGDESPTIAAVCRNGVWVPAVLEDASLPIPGEFRQVILEEVTPTSEDDE